MTQTPDAVPQSLYGEEPRTMTPVSPLALGEVIQELVSSPSALFRRLADRPTWLMPMLLSVGTGLLMSGLWVWKMDPLASVQANLEVTGRWMEMLGQRLPEQAVQQALDNASRPVGTTLAGALILPCLVLLVLSLLLWAAARMGSMTEDRPVTFKHAVSVAVIQGLPMALTQLLTCVMVLVKPVGGLTVTALNPGTVGYFLAPEGLGARGITVGLLDPLYLCSWVLMVMGLKYTLRAKTWAIVLVCVLVGLVAIPVRFMGGMY